MGEAHGTQNGEEKYIVFRWRKLLEKGYLEDTGTNDRITRWTVDIQDAQSRLD